MTIEPIAYFHSPMTSKFGIPRQSGLAMELHGRIVFEPAYRHEEAVRGLDQFDYLWAIWEFSHNKNSAGGLTVRPPRLGGNERVGVFASRSPYRPNRLGLSCLYINKVEMSAQLGPVIYVQGADLMDGTPIYDIKPYIVYADSHPEARCGFVDTTLWHPLTVEIPSHISKGFSHEEISALRAVLTQDPRPRYHDDADRVYGMSFGGYNIRFKVEGDVLTVVEVVPVVS